MRNYRAGAIAGGLWQKFQPNAAIFPDVALQLQRTDMLQKSAEPPCGRVQAEFCRARLRACGTWFIQPVADLKRICYWEEPTQIQRYPARPPPTRSGVALSQRPDTAWKRMEESATCNKAESTTLILRMPKKFGRDRTGWKDLRCATKQFL